MSFIHKKSIGIIGGGQLAKMLSASIQKMGATAHIYSENPTDPGATTTAFHTKGKSTDYKKIEKWAKDLDIITFESEFIELSNIKLGKHAPNSKSMMLLRDRLSQKTLLEKFKIPTSRFTQPTKESAFKTPLVLKQRLFGYDGYGTLICKNKDTYNKFIKTEGTLDSWIEEDFIPFKKELAFSIARTKDNNFTVLPLVETFQKDSKCFWVKGPVENKKLNPLITKAKKLLTHLNYTGIIAFELFETKSGNLLVNEVAPRVHNSAHYSIEGLPLSQFDIHILSILNQKLPSKIKPHKAFAMVNLIGTSTKNPKLQAFDNGCLHWYGKLQNRPGRKMGHLTVLDSTPNKALNLALKAEKGQIL
ncbi:MAG: ATP-grasp domain-containing protein [Bdellovibrionales bacterium]